MSVTKPERTTENDPTMAAATAAVEQVEGEIRAFVRRDVSSFRRPRTESGDPAVDNISSVIERVSGASVAEIDRVIGEDEPRRESFSRLQYLRRVLLEAMRQTQSVPLVKWTKSSRQALGIITAGSQGELFILQLEWAENTRAVVASRGAR